jgi:hypothetical protein
VVEAKEQSVNKNLPLWCKVHVFLQSQSFWPALGQTDTTTKQNIALQKQRKTTIDTASAVISKTATKTTIK